MKVQDFQELGIRWAKCVEQKSVKFLFGYAEWFVLNTTNKMSEDRYLEL